MTKITITRALAELKLLDSRISNTIGTFIPVDLYTQRHPQLQTTKKTLDIFQKDVKSDYQSINDLIKRRSMLKSMIMISNSKITVTIAGKTMTVAEAIDMKEIIKYKEHLLRHTMSNILNTFATCDNLNAKVENQIDAMVLNSYGSKDKKVTGDEYENIAKPYREANLVKIADPLNIKMEMDRLQNEIEMFKSEVDFVLSESNAKTEIMIED